MLDRARKLVRVQAANVEGDLLLPFGIACDAQVATELPADQPAHLQVESNAVALRFVINLGHHDRLLVLRVLIIVEHLVDLEGAEGVDGLEIDGEVDLAFQLVLHLRDVVDLDCAVTLRRVHGVPDHVLKHSGDAVNVGEHADV